MIQRIASRIVYEGRWSVRVDTLALPDGRTLEKATVVHPGSVVLVPIREGAGGAIEVLMLRQYRLSLDQTILELPAGTREPGEPLQNCAHRELREETGFAAGSLLSLGEVWPAPGVTDERMAIFLARDLRHDPLPGDVDEEIVVETWPLAELAAMALDGRLEDAKSVVALLRAARELALQNL